MGGIANAILRRVKVCLAAAIIRLALFDPGIERRTKDELITAYLASRDQPTLMYYARWFAESSG